MSVGACSEGRWVPGSRKKRPPSAFGMRLPPLPLLGPVITSATTALNGLRSRGCWSPHQSRKWSRCYPGGPCHCLSQPWWWGHFVRPAISSAWKTATFGPTWHSSWNSKGCPGWDRVSGDAGLWDNLTGADAVLLVNELLDSIDWYCLASSWTSWHWIFSGLQPSCLPWLCLRHWKS